MTRQQRRAFERRVRKLQAAAERKGGLAGRPGVAVANVRHDDDCPALRAQSLAACTCDPEVRLAPAPAGDGPEAA